MIVLESGSGPLPSNVTESLCDILSLSCKNKELRALFMILITMQCEGRINNNNTNKNNYFVKEGVGERLFYKNHFPDRTYFLFGKVFLSKCNDIKNITTLTLHVQ